MNERGEALGWFSGGVMACVAVHHIAEFIAQWWP